MTPPTERAHIASPEAIEHEWAALWARVPDATPFQHPAWLVPWWRHLGEGELRLRVLREQEGLAALLPLYVHRGAARHSLFLIGIGTTDYLDALVAPGHAEAVMAALFRSFVADGFDRAEWPQLRAGSPLLCGAAPPGWHDASEAAEPCPLLVLPDSAEGLRASIPGKTLRDLRTARRRAAEAGATFEQATETTLDEIREALLRLHAARWAGREEPGVLAAPPVRAMHREAIPALLRNGLPWLTALRLGGEVVAVLYALADPPGRARRTLHLYLQGFDPALERLSPGLLLVGEALDFAMAEGFHALDFLRGQERYKAFWGATPTATFRRVLTPPESMP